jgi:hypothetical protein
MQTRSAAQRRSAQVLRRKGSGVHEAPGKSRRSALNGSQALRRLYYCSRHIPRPSVIRQHERLIRPFCDVRCQVTHRRGWCRGCRKRGDSAPVATSPLAGRNRARGACLLTASASWSHGKYLLVVLVSVRCSLRIVNSRGPVLTARGPVTSFSRGNRLQLAAAPPPPPPPPLPPPPPPSPHIMRPTGGVMSSASTLLPICYVAHTLAQSGRLCKHSSNQAGSGLSRQPGRRQVASVGRAAMESRRVSFERHR